MLVSSLASISDLIMKINYWNVVARPAPSINIIKYIKIHTEEKSGVWFVQYCAYRISFSIAEIIALENGGRVFKLIYLY